MPALLVINLCLAQEGLAATVSAGFSGHDNKEVVKQMLARAELKYKIPKGLLAAIAEVESGYRAYAVNIGGRPAYPDSLAKAVLTVQGQIKAGRNNLDLGIMQLNYRWHGRHFKSLAEMLTPAKNIAYAARLLNNLYRQHGSWYKAVQYYHSARSEHNSKYSRKVAIVWLAGKQLNTTVSMCANKYGL